MTPNPLSNVPRKVIEEARKQGVHNDCLVAGTNSCCEQCFDIMMKAFDLYYGDSKTAVEFMTRVLDDVNFEKESA